MISLKIYEKVIYQRKSLQFLHEKEDMFLPDRYVREIVLLTRRIKLVTSVRIAEIWMSMF